MLLPLYGFLHGDTLGVLVLVQDTEKVSDIAASLQQAATMRVAPRTEKCHVVHRGELLDPDAVIADTPISALDRVDVTPFLPPVGRSFSPPVGPNGDA